jgi:hypothetical protein
MVVPIATSAPTANALAAAQSLTQPAAVKVQTNQLMATTNTRPLAPETATARGGVRVVGQVLPRANLLTRSQKID